MATLLELSATQLQLGNKIFIANDYSVLSSGASSGQVNVPVGRTFDLDQGYFMTYSVDGDVIAPPDSAPINDPYPGTPLPPSYYRWL